MRKYLLKTSEGLAGRILETTEQTTGVICVALDLEVAGAAVALSFRGKAARFFGKSSREEILGALKPLVALGNRVVCVQEICGFGYWFHRELQAAGVESLVVAPEALNGRRKTDKRDVGKLCLLLVDHVLRENRGDSSVDLRRFLHRRDERNGSSSPMPRIVDMDWTSIHLFDGRIGIINFGEPQPCDSGLRQRQVVPSQARPAFSCAGLKLNRSCVFECARANHPLCRLQCTFVPL